MKRNTKKVWAIGAAAAVVGVGGLATLAAWNDSEWIFAGDGAGNPGLGTSSFNVQQNRGTEVPLAEGSWEDQETNPGGEVVFTPGALNLTPGDSVYAPVALRTAEPSIGGNLTLQQPVEAAGLTNDAGLWGALTYSVRATETPTTCDAATWDGFGTEIVSAQGLDTAITPEAQEVAADGGNVQYYCFQVTLPADTADVDALQGQAVAPAWEFIAESVDGETAGGGA